MGGDRVVVTGGTAGRLPRLQRDSNWGEAGGGACGQFPAGRSHVELPARSLSNQCATPTPPFLASDWTRMRRAAASHLPLALLPPPLGGRGAFSKPPDDATPPRQAAIVTQRPSFSRPDFVFDHPRSPHHNSSHAPHRSIRALTSHRPPVPTRPHTAHLHRRGRCPSICLPGAKPASSRAGTLLLLKPPRRSVGRP